MILLKKHQSRSPRPAPVFFTSPARPLRHIGLLALVLFTVSLSANLVSPLLPYLLATSSLPLPMQERHAAFLSGSYLLAMFTAGPLGGQLSDRIGRRPVLLGGMAVFTISLYALAATSGVLDLYDSRVLSGMGAGALLPVLLAHVSEHSAEADRVRRFAWLVSAVMIGGIIGPYLGGLAVRADTWNWIGMAMPQRLLAVPVLAGAIASSIALGGMVFILPRRAQRQPQVASPASGGTGLRPVALYALFLLSVFLMFAVGAVEVGLATLSRQTLQLDAASLGMMYTTCALVMLVMQALFFAAPFKDFANRHLLFPAFLVTAIGVVLVPLAGSIDRLAWAVAAVAGGAGLIAPVLSYRVSLLAEGRQGKSFGLQSAASNLGQALGSAGSGVLFGLDPHLPYWLAATFLVAAALWILLRMQPPYVPDIARSAHLD